MAVTATSTRPPQYADLLERHLTRICADAGATSARIIILDRRQTWVEHVATAERDARHDEVLVELFTRCGMQPLTVNTSRDGTMVEHADVSADCQVVLIASYARAGEGPRAAGYVRHEIRRKLRHLCRDLARTQIK
jgi:hypothetical protein